MATDKEIKAKPEGYRFKGDNNKRPLVRERSKANVYFEGRKNRSDKNLTKKLAKGGNPEMYSYIVIEEGGDAQGSEDGKPIAYYKLKTPVESFDGKDKWMINDNESSSRVNYLACIWQGEGNAPSKKDISDFIKANNLDAKEVNPKEIFVKEGSEVPANKKKLVGEALSVINETGWHITDIVKGRVWYLEGDQYEDNGILDVNSLIEKGRMLLDSRDWGHEGYTLAAGGKTKSDYDADTLARNTKRKQHAKGGYIYTNEVVKKIMQDAGFKGDDDTLYEAAVNSGYRYDEESKMWKSPHSDKLSFSDSMATGGGVKTDWEKRENLERFLSFTNDDIYWKWVNNEITDAEAISFIADIDGVQYDEKTTYASGGSMAKGGKTTEPKLGYFIQMESDRPDEARYYQIGIKMPGGFTGLVHDYMGGGSYDTLWAFEGDTLDEEDEEGEFIEPDEREKILINKIYQKYGQAYAKRIIKDIKQKEKELFDFTDYGATIYKGKIAPKDGLVISGAEFPRINVGNTIFRKTQTFGQGGTIKDEGLFDFLDKTIHITW